MPATTSTKTTFLNAPTETYAKTSLTTATSPTYQSSTSGVTDREGARGVAKRILDTYDRDRNGVIDNEEVVPMIIDAYKSFNRVFSPSSADIESYLKILSKNGDGKVTVRDLEDICNRYLTSKI